jgi:putative hemolysin
MKICPDDCRVCNFWERRASDSEQPMEAHVPAAVQTERTAQFTPANAPATAQYSVRLAETDAERTSAFRLRFRVFNLELNEGLESAFEDGLDRDEFDPQCDHLIILECSTGEVIGTYRLQTGRRAHAGIGFYSAREFEFAVYEGFSGAMLELGRACIHPEHRTFEVMNLLWRGIAAYAHVHESRYLIGCTSLTSQDEATGIAAYRLLEPWLVTPDLRTVPLDAFLLNNVGTGAEVKIPRLLRAYLALGAKICGPPAIDREFKTIDFLTLLDLESLSPSARMRYLGI